MGTTGAVLSHQKPLTQGKRPNGPTPWEQAGGQIESSPSQIIARTSMPDDHFLMIND
jgi:hypothetical protein